MSEIIYGDTAREKLETLKKCRNERVWDIMTVDHSEVLEEVINIAIEALDKQDLQEVQIKALLHDLDIKDRANNQMGRMLREANAESKKLRELLHVVHNDNGDEVVTMGNVHDIIKGMMDNISKPTDPTLPPDAGLIVLDSIPNMNIAIISPPQSSTSLLAKAILDIDIKQLEEFKPTIYDDDDRTPLMRKMGIKKKRRR